MEEKVRLQKHMAQCGVSSRRHAEELIRAGRVKVNGVVIREMGVLVSDKDMIEVDNKLIKKEERLVYIMLNKPSGYVTTVTDPQDRNTVMDLISEVKERVYPVGRLDYDTTGLLILTNDGDFAYFLTHPSQEIKKTYLAEVSGFPSKDSMNLLRKGVILDGRPTAKAEAYIVKSKAKSTLLKIIISEGRNRQVKRMCEKVGHPVISLERISIGTLTLGDLKKGQWRHLTTREVKAFRGDKK